MKRRHCLIALLALAALVPLRAQDAADTTAPGSADRVINEEWMIAFVQDKRCGFGSTILRERSTPEGRQYITDIHQEYKFSRQGHVLNIVSRSSVVEDEAGTVICFQSKTSGLGSDVVARGYRVGGEMVLFNGAQQQRVPLPREALGPQALDRKNRELKKTPGATYTAQAFLTDYPQSTVKMTVTMVGRETREVNGQPHTLWKTTSTMDVMPGLVTTSYLNDQSRAELVIMPFPGLGEFQLVTATRAEAMKQLESFEIFTNSLITPSTPLRNLRSLRTATLRLTIKNGRDPITLWSGPEQRLLESKPGQSTVQINMPGIDGKTASWTLPHAADPALKPYLNTSFYIEKTPRLQELAQQAVGNEKNPVLAARKIESFVSTYIRRKDFSVGFASADETAASRAGDCTEHSVLCAALGRAVGLPTRLVVGLGYLPGIGADKNQTGNFGFHMWAEAWIGPDQWLPMDAALGGFDVGHIAIGKTSLQEVNPLAELTMPVLKLMQNLQIEVLDAK